MLDQIPSAYIEIGRKLITSILIVVLTLFGQRFVHAFLGRRIKDPVHSHTVRMLTRNALYFVAGAGVLLIWLGVGSNFAVVMGVLGAGIAFASQEVIGSFAGYLNIVTSSLFRIGDRVSIGNVVGDVLDLSILRTTVMEIGDWVKADQYTGRIVTVANRAVFSDPVYNYTLHMQYLWDEITLPVTYNSDWRLAEEIMLTHGLEYSKDILDDARHKLEIMRDRYPLQETSVEPTLYVVMTDNWIELTLRYVVAADQRRTVKGHLHRELLKHFEAEPNITVASATFEIVGLPPVRYRSAHSDEL